MIFLKRLLVVPLIFITILSHSETEKTESENTEPSDTTYWHLKSTGMLNINQVAFSNWAEGGESNISGSVLGNFKANYFKKKFKADNYISLAYGLSWNKEQDWRKSDDKIDLGTTVGYEAFDHWFYSFMFNMKTQFSKGFKYPNDSTVVSRFFAPGRMFLSMGMEYKPDKHTSIFISPASGKFIFVMDQDLADRGAFGVTPAETDTLGNVLNHGSNYKPKFGVNLVLNLNRDLMKNVNMDTKLNLHNNYMDETLTNRWNFDVDWETSVNFKINSSLSSMLFMHLMYDHDIPLPTYETIEGEKVQTGNGPRLQVKENFGIGVTIKV